MAPTVRSTAGEEQYPYPAYNYRVSVTNIDSGETVSGSFSEVSGLMVEVTPIEYRAGTYDTTVRKIRGLRKVSNITLKRGISGHIGFWNWILAGIDGDAQRQEGYIALLNEDRAEVMRWTFKQAWPTKYTGPSLNAKNNEIAIETLEIAVEDLLIQL
ncbi:MAG: phage tail protein [Actinobacteria bacterium 13_2_20CM_2_71_6]|nr:MAG: phage tail protein [Actinobacteria bacterium 13_2_20CM_2_71_6]